MYNNFSVSGSVTVGVETRQQTVIAESFLDNGQYIANTERDCATMLIFVFGWVRKNE